MKKQHTLLTPENTPTVVVVSGVFYGYHLATSSEEHILREAGVLAEPAAEGSAYQNEKGKSE